MCLPAREFFLFFYGRDMGKKSKKVYKVLKICYMIWR